MLLFVQGMYNTLEITDHLQFFHLIITSQLPSADGVLSFANFTLFFDEGLMLIKTNFFFQSSAKNNMSQDTIDLWILILLLLWPLASLCLLQALHHFLDLSCLLDIDLYNGHTFDNCSTEYDFYWVFFHRLFLSILASPPMWLPWLKDCLWFDKLSSWWFPLPVELL